MFRHADVVCLCLVCILWQFSIMYDLLFVNASDMLSIAVLTNEV